MSNTEGRFDVAVHEQANRSGLLTLTCNRYDAKRQLSVLNFLTLQIRDGMIAGAYLTPATEYYP